MRGYPRVFTGARMDGSRLSVAPHRLHSEACYGQRQVLTYRSRPQLLVYGLQSDNLPAAVLADLDQGFSLH